MNADDYVLATGMTTRMRHVVRRWGTTPSMLVLGSKDYDTDVHRRALCGSITEFTDAEATDDPDECCFRCWHTAFARDLVDDPAPFTEEDMASNKRPVTDGGQSVDDTDQDPPARDGEINTIPDLNDGDRVTVRSAYNHESGRNLEVIDASPSDEDIQRLMPRCLFGYDGGDAYLLEGYGTEYLLCTRGTNHWRSVCLTWPSDREPTPVSEIEIVERWRPMLTDTDRAQITILAKVILGMILALFVVFATAVLYGGGL